MKADIITTGTEYLIGMIKENDSHYLAGRLAELDVQLRSRILTGDDPADLKTILAESFRQVDIVLVTGAAGYGKDPRYAELFAAFFEDTCSFSDKALSYMKDFAQDKQLNVTEEEMKRLAVLPENAEIFQNHTGLTCGYILAGNEKHLIVLPGYSQEIRAFFEDDVVGYIYKTVSCGRAEYVMEIDGSPKNGKEDCTTAWLKEKLEPLPESDNPELTILKNGKDYEIRVRAVGPTKADASVLAGIVVNDCISRIGSDRIRQVKELER